MRSASAHAVLQLIRWHNGIISIIGVLAGAWWSGGLTVATPVVLACAAAFALAAFANVVNDIHDVEIDRIAHPRRPLPNGAISVPAARGIAIAAAIAGAALAALSRPELGVLSVVVLMIMYEYSRSIKRRGLPGNVVVAVLASLPFVYGAWAVNRPVAGVVLAIVAAPMHLARELAKDLQDAGGDARYRRTLAVVSPRRAKQALLASMATFAGALLVFLFPRPAAALALLPAAAVAAVATWRSVHDRPGGPRLFKSAMVLAMLSLFTIHPPTIR
jgi:geranylgeranylglycerol-phosphate geranylgeranyltransferase